MSFQRMPCGGGTCQGDTLHKDLFCTVCGHRSMSPSEHRQMATIRRHKHFGATVQQRGLRRAMIERAKSFKYANAVRREAKAKEFEGLGKREHRAACIPVRRGRERTKA